MTRTTPVPGSTAPTQTRLGSLFYKTMSDLEDRLGKGRSDGEPRAKRTHDE